MLEAEEAVKGILPYSQCTLVMIPGIDTVIATNILPEVRNIERFPSVSKLAEFAGAAPVNSSSAGKDKDMCPKQGDRRLQTIFYFPAIQMM